MQKIFKYPLTVMDMQIITVPQGAKPFSAILQDGAICLYAFHTEQGDFLKKQIRVYIFGTGNPILNKNLNDLTFIASIQQGPFVWHVFTGE